MQSVEIWRCKQMVGRNAKGIHLAHNQQYMDIK